MIEGSGAGAGSITLTSGSGSDPGGPKHVDPVEVDPDPQHWLLAELNMIKTAHLYRWFPLPNVFRGTGKVCSDLSFFTEDF
jgi:hypothetical protein